MDPDVTSVIRDIFVIVAAGVFALLCLAVLLVFIKLYRPLRETTHNAARATENIGAVAEDLAAVSAETAKNVLETSRNAVAISERLKEGSEDLPSTVRTAREAANKVSDLANSAKGIVDMVTRVGSLGITGGGPSGVGTLLRIVRGLFGGGRKSDDGAQQA